MTGSNNPRFRLLVGWCCLMSSALLIMTVYLGTSLHKKSETNKTGNEESNSTETITKPGQLIGSHYGLSFNDYISLIRDKNETWICSDSCESRSLSLNNNTVEIKTSGFYYIHAQVIFDKAIHQTKKQARVILLKNRGPATQVRKLSEGIRFEPGTLTMIRLVMLTKGESISLDIQPESLRLSIEACHTYWEILLYNK
ncbi:lymphotoxin-alpha [Rhinichthys klamathensis goyatoka]|uniref:lymphotoxin-alpha n=1 Tax=Rhinichthys klamathensis goyatoka TaxID=3034132 RepID=UPI0024B5BE37|nr:lymphotoxin-alpha [Rhinichthys klamathensis goyatoka]